MNWKYNTVVSSTFGRLSGCTFYCDVQQAGATSRSGSFTAFSTDFSTKG